MTSQNLDIENPKMARRSLDKLQDIPDETPTVETLLPEYFDIIGKLIHGKLNKNMVLQIQCFKLKIPSSLHPYIYEYLLHATEQGLAETFDQSSYRHLYVLAIGMTLSITTTTTSSYSFFISLSVS